MHVGIDASRVTVGQRTGTENYSYSLIRALAQVDQSNRYSLYFRDVTSAFSHLPASFESRPIPFPRLWTHTRLAWEMAQNAPEVLFVPAHVVPLVHPRATVVTVHDLGYLYHPDSHTKGARLYLHLSTRFSVHAATKVIAVSQATKRDLVDRYGADSSRIAVVHHGYDDRFKPVEEASLLETVRNTYGLGAEYLLFLGTIQPRKNLGRLLEAFAMLVKEEGIPHQLVLAGRPGWFYDTICARVRSLGLEDRVVFTGYVPDEHLPALVSGASLLVEPSLHEGFGIPIIEAMACGTPVVAANISALPEIAGEAALLVDPMNVRSIARGIGEALSAGRQAELREKGLRRVKDFSWVKCARETLAVLEEAHRAALRGR
ncbi:MAG: glycosyltransferase family 4 protein [Chloroflexi bacterium]|nr:glycosyltransferase family 4 protein [Chloroflexota bacterium]